ncbi:MAG TPA: TOBE domain-containing protein [Dissulfurispiraceae bacterium]|nr:TOBE domain-containing protein [Dissulfurispiraceae bacterium]
MPEKKPSVASFITHAKGHGRIVSMRHDRQYFDPIELARIEKSFRKWEESATRTDVRLSRRRILLIFLLIRYTGAKLNEVLALDPLRDIDYKKRAVYFRNAGGDPGRTGREVQISEALSDELRHMLADTEFKRFIEGSFTIDPGFVRLKFYERAKMSGFSMRMGGPEMIRKSRAVELMQADMPLPAVQKLMGHSTPNLTSSYVTFSEDEIRQVTKHFMERESSRKTSARNTFFGKISNLRQGDIQTLVELSTIEGHRVTTIITNDSVGRLGLNIGKMITAEVKAPSLIIQKSDGETESSAENRFSGVVTQINTGKINTEYVVDISESTKLCSIITSESGRRLNLKKGDRVWVLFNCFAVVLNVD